MLKIGSPFKINYSPGTEPKGFLISPAILSLSSAAPVSANSVPLHYSQNLLMKPDAVEIIILVFRIFYSEYINRSHHGTSCSRLLTGDISAEVKQIVY
jgi:hypothetical protein